jgi:hypothetical protein
MTKEQELIEARRLCIKKFAYDAWPSATCIVMATLTASVVEKRCFQIRKKAMKDTT